MRKRKKHSPLGQEDNAFFQSFYDEYKSYIYFTVCKFSADPTEREDMVQDATLRLINNVSTLRQLNRYTTLKYIVLTIKSVYIDGEKRKMKDNVIYLNEQDLEALLIEQYITQDAEQKVNANMVVAKLREELPARDWLVLEGKYLLELSQEEIGSLIGVAPDSVRMVLHRAREKARKILEQDAVAGGELL